MLKHMQHLLQTIFTAMVGLGLPKATGSRASAVPTHFFQKIKIEGYAILPLWSDVRYANSGA